MRRKTLIAIASIAVLVAALVALVGGKRARDAPNQPTVAQSSRRAVAPGPSADAVPGWFGRPDLPQRHIRGRVVHRGRPIAGARVSLASYLSQTGTRPSPIVVTNSAGEFDLGLLIAEQFNVVGEADGLGATVVRVDLRDPDADPSPEALVLELPGCDHVLHGTIVDASGGVIAGAAVRAALFGQPSGTGARTDKDGHFELCVAKGKHAFVAGAAGYGSIEAQVMIRGRTRHDFSLVPEAVVAGVVVRSADGAPVPLALVRLVPTTFSNELQPASAWALSDADGRFEIHGVAPGRHNILAYTEDLSSEPRSLDVDAAEVIKDLVLSLRPTGATISGRIVASSKPVRGARIRAVRREPWRESLATYSGADGAFLLKSVPLGKVAFEIEGFQVVSPSTLEVARDVADQVIEVSDKASLGGRVVTSDGQPAPGATVIAMSSGASRARKATADANGHFVLRGIEAGTVRVQATSEAAAARTSKAREVTVTLGEGERVDHVELVLDGVASIAGRVVDERGTPQTQVSLAITSLDQHDGCVATTDDRGAFVCDGLAGGASYVPAASLYGVKLKPVKGTFPAIEVADTKTAVTGVSIVVAGRRARLHGKVTTRDDRPVPDARVRATRDGDAEDGFSLTPAISDLNGAFSIDVWDSGTYSVEARGQHGSTAALHGATPGREDLVLVLSEDGGALEVTLEGFPSESSCVALASGTEEPLYATISANVARLDRLHEGWYAVYASFGAAISATRLRVVSGQTTRATLQYRPAASARVSIRDFDTGAPVPGVACRGGIASTDAIPWSFVKPQIADASGLVTVQVPAGPARVHCLGVQGRTTDSGAFVELESNATGDVALVAVSRTSVLDNSPGFRLDPGRDGSIVNAVRDSSEARLQLGDVITSVDDRDVRRLTPWGVLTVIGRKPEGAKVSVGSNRSGAALQVELTLGPPWLDP